MRVLSILSLILLLASPTTAAAGDDATSNDAAASDSAPTGESTDGGDAPTEKVTDFTLRSVDGGNVSLSDFLGEKVIIVNFWATWCGPCQKEMQHLDAMQKELGPKLQVISISVDAAKDEAKVKAFVKRLQYSPVVLLDSDQRVVRTFHPRGVPPWSMIVGRDKLIHLKKLGFTEGDEEKIRATVDKLLAS